MNAKLFVLSTFLIAAWSDLQASGATPSTRPRKLTNQEIYTLNLECRSRRFTGRDLVLVVDPNSFEIVHAELRRDSRDPIIIDNRDELAKIETLVCTSAAPTVAAIKNLLSVTFRFRENLVRFPERDTLIIEYRNYVARELVGNIKGFLRAVDQARVAIQRTQSRFELKARLGQSTQKIYGPTPALANQEDTTKNQTSQEENFLDLIRTTAWHSMFLSRLEGRTLFGSSAGATESGPESLERVIYQELMDWIGGSEKAPSTAPILIDDDLRQGVHVRLRRAATLAFEGYDLSQMFFGQPNTDCAAILDIVSILNAPDTKGNQ